ncbi:hypothetical protein B0H15DRAFT_954602 [Mycena belliarum]|uniref:Uncharacterized protein n=1 Tax=Mycena belliarum TaxID=1033014 RepID=A0AAD6TT02_9AGAR|nr:hypothetical protein B0H15DRAFT_954602 [Mycena belliae]
MRARPRKPTRRRSAKPTRLAPAICRACRAVRESARRCPCAAFGGDESVYVDSSPCPSICVVPPPRPSGARPVRAQCSPAYTFPLSIPAQHAALADARPSPYPPRPRSPTRMPSSQLTRPLFCSRSARPYRTSGATLERVRSITSAPYNAPPSAPAATRLYTHPVAFISVSARPHLRAAPSTFSSQVGRPHSFMHVVSPLALTFASPVAPASRFRMHATRHFPLLRPSPALQYLRGTSALSRRRSRSSRRHAVGRRRGSALRCAESDPGDRRGEWRARGRADKRNSPLPCARRAASPQSGLLRQFFGRGAEIWERGVSRRSSRPLCALRAGGATSPSRAESDSNPDDCRIDLRGGAWICGRSSSSRARLCVAAKLGDGRNRFLVEYVAEVVQSRHFG